jgi:hypothetical protein
MKKYLALLLSVCLIGLFFAGCAEKEPKYPAPRISPEQEQARREKAQEKAAEEASEETVDIDLTALSSTMVYAEVNNIMTTPEDYLGKTITMSGPYLASDDGSGLVYHYVLIVDALACCQSGLEFKLNGEHSYPEDYPEANVEVEATGVFGKYEELGLTYYYLEVDELTVL